MQHPSSHIELGEMLAHSEIDTIDRNQFLRNHLRRRRARVRSPDHGARVRGLRQNPAQGPPPTRPGTRYALGPRPVLSALDERTHAPLSPRLHWPLRPLAQRRAAFRLAGGGDGQLSRCAHPRRALAAAHRGRRHPTHRARRSRAHHRHARTLRFRVGRRHRVAKPAQRSLPCRARTSAGSRSRLCLRVHAPRDGRLRTRARWLTALPRHLS